MLFQLFKIHLRINFVVVPKLYFSYNILRISLKVSNRLVLNVLNFKIQRISETLFKSKPLRNKYSNNMQVFNNWQMQYKPIVPQNISIVIKCLLIIFREFFEMLLWSNIMQQRVKLRKLNIYTYDSVYGNVNLATFGKMSDRCTV